MNDTEFAELMRRLEYSRLMEDRLAEQLEQTFTAMRSERATQREVIKHLFTPLKQPNVKPVRGRPRKGKL